MFLRKVSLYTISIYVNTILSSLQGIMVARFLEPYFMGYFSQIKVFLSYMMMINIGFINGLLITLPLANKRKTEEFISAGFWISLISYIIGSVFFVIIFLLNKDKVFLYMAIIFPIYGVKELPVFIMRGRGQFKRLSVFYLIISTINFILIVSLVYFYKFKGALMALAIGVLISFIVGIIISDIKIKFQIIKTRVIELFQKGIYIYMGDFFRFLRSSMEKFVMIFFIPRDVYAIYTIGIVMISFFDIIPSTVFQYLLPDFIKYSKNWTKDKMLETINLITFIMSICLIIAIYVFTLFIPIIIPDYTASLRIFYILSFTSIINIWIYIIYNKFISENKLKFMYISQLIGLIAMLLGIYVLYVYNTNLIKEPTAIAFIILISRLFFIGSLMYLFAKKVDIKLINKNSIFVLFISFLFILISIIFVSIQIHLIPLIILLYFVIFYKKVKQWKKDYL